MSYTPNNWQTGDTVTAARLNAAEEELVALEEAKNEADARMEVFCEELEVDSEGLVYLLNNGERIAGPYGPFAGGGGGSGGNNAVLSVVNSSGWLAKTIAEGTDCVIALTWSSLEAGIETGNGIITFKINDVVRITVDAAQGLVETNVGRFLESGKNSIAVTVSDVYGNSKTIKFTVTCVSLSLASNFDSSVVMTGDIAYTYIPIGNVSKTVYFVLDGVTIGTTTATVSGRQLTYNIPAQEHGAHNLLVYMVADLDGEQIKSNELYYDLICVEDGDNTPIIASPYRETETTQYSTVAIPYIVYQANSLTTDIELIVNGDTVSTLSVDRTEHVWSYRADTIGTLEMTIKAGAVTKSFTLTVSESAIDAHVTTEDLALSLQAHGRSNSEANPGTWTYNDISCEFSGFNFTSDGWVLDETNTTVLRVGGNARLTIPYKPFEFDFRSTGKTIEIEFATRDVLNFDAPIFSCMSGGRGLVLTSQKATLKSEQSEVSTQYKEDDHVRISFVVEKRAENRLLMVYINSIPSGVIQYPADDDFSQVNPVNITIGSSLCTMDIYSIRIYDNNLTRHQILDNWIAETTDTTLMLDRYNRNHIYDEYGKIVIDKLPKDLPYMILNAAELPQYKGDKKTITGSYVNPSDSSKSFEFTGCQINVQGTSSAPYVRKNYDLQFKNGFELASGHEDNYELTDDTIAFNRFVLKADVASSEGANNVELVRLYCEINPWRSREEIADPKVRQGIDGFPIVVFWNDTTTDSISFLGKYNFNLPKRAPEPYGYSGDMESWEFQNNTSDNMLFKGVDFTSTYVDPETGETYPAWKNDFEARFPEDTWEDIDKLKEFCEFVVSTRRELATDELLPEPVTYDGIEYTNDTATYRLAKFRNEFPTYADLDSFIFYYIFTELFLMVDSRAKNLFIGFNGSDVTVSGREADRKAVAQPYDMDTGLGTNNEGSLVFGYGLEDIDHLAGGANVFNGQDSTLWCNIRDSYRSEIVNMYKMLRTQVLSYDTVEARYEAHQSKWPEAVWIEDAWFKYIDPLINPDKGKEPTAVYLPMMQGSKKEQRKWWLSNRFRYMDSKWNAGDAVSRVIQLRGYAKANITVTPCADIYPTVKYASYLVQERGYHDQPTTLICPLDSVNDTEIYIYSAPQISSIGDLSGLKVGFADFSNGIRLQSVKVGDSDPNYENPNLDNLVLGSNKLLKTIDARNCTKLGTGDQKTVDLSGCEIIENVYFDNTKIQGVTLPNGGRVSVLHLPNTITNLTLMNQMNITDLTIAGYSNISTLRLENTALDVRFILNQIQANARVRIIGFNWDNAAGADIVAFYNKLDTMRGLDEAGNNVDTAQVSGTIHTDLLTGEQIDAISGKYPYITVIAAHISVTLTYKTFDGATVIDTETIVDSGDGTKVNSTARPMDAQYAYAPNGWATTPNGPTDADALKSVSTNRTVYAAYVKTLRTYTVTWKNEDNTVLETDLNVPYGTTPTYDGPTPTYEGVVAIGWIPDIGPVTGPTEYVAKYVNKYNITFVKAAEDGGGTLATYRVPEGTTPSYSGSTPTTTRGSASDYPFAGWTPALAPAYADATYTAKFTDMTSNARKFINRTIVNVSNNNVTNIGSNSFNGCSRLTSVNFPAATSIGSNAFDSCSSLTSVNFPAATSIVNNAFYKCSGLTSVNFPLVTSIGDYAFYKCSSLTSVDFPLVTSIGSNSFNGCSGFTSVNFPAATSIGSNSFNGCSGLTSVNFPVATSIGSNSFNGCSGLTSVNFPAATSIGNYAFRSCSGLTSVILRANQVATLSNTNAFPSNTIIYVPDDLVDSYKVANNWSTIADRIKGISEIPSD